MPLEIVTYIFYFFVLFFVGNLISILLEFVYNLIKENTWGQRTKKIEKLPVVYKEKPTRKKKPTPTWWQRTRKSAKDAWWYADVVLNPPKPPEPTFTYSKVLNKKKEKGKYKVELELLLPVEVLRYAETRSLWKNLYVVPWGPICWLKEKNITTREFDDDKGHIEFQQLAEKRIQFLVGILQKIKEATKDPIANAFSFVFDYQEQLLLKLCVNIKEPEKIDKEYDTILGLYQEELDEIRKFIPQKVEGKGMFRMLDVPKDNFFAFVEYYIFSRPENPYYSEVFSLFCDRYVKNVPSYKKACEVRAQKLTEYFNEDWRKRVVHSDVLENTPVYPYLTQEEPYSIPLKYRNKHLVVFASSGWGKTMLLKRLIEYTDTGFIVIDSQGDLINMLSHIKFNREVILIDPSDVEHPLAMSPFNIDLSGLSTKETEGVLNAVLKMYLYMFRSIMGQKLNTNQEKFFTYVTKLLVFHVPNATIFTMKDVFEDGEKYRKYMDKMTKQADREFFEREWGKRGNQHTKDEIVSRLYSVLSDNTFSRMLSQTENKFDLYDAMCKDKIILINTDQDHMPVNYKNYGTFWLAQLVLATMKRTRIQENKRKPYMVYIDEIRDYMEATEPLKDLIAQARKYNVGLNMFFQSFSQSEDIGDLLLDTTWIRMAGGISKVAPIAESMHVSKEFVQDTHFKEGVGSSFALGVKSEPTRKVWLDFGALSDKPQMNEIEYEMFEEQNRKRYCVEMEQQFDERKTEEYHGGITIDGEVVEDDDIDPWA